MAGVAAIVTARDLSLIPRNVIVVVLAAIVVTSGIAEVTGRVQAPQPGVMPMTFLEAFPLITVFVSPLIVASVIITVADRAAVVPADSDSGRSRVRGAGAGAAIALLICALITAGGFLPFFVPLADSAWAAWVQPWWLITPGSAVATVAAVLVFHRLPASASSRRLGKSARVSGYLTLACGMLLCVLALAHVRLRAGQHHGRLGRSGIPCRLAEPAHRIHGGTVSADLRPQRPGLRREHLTEPAKVPIN